MRIWKTKHIPRFVLGMTACRSRAMAAGLERSRSRARHESYRGLVR
jgi:hypothetical protein